jgi:hypothetical protein
MNERVARTESSGNEAQDGQHDGDYDGGFHIVFTFLDFRNGFIGRIVIP